MACKVAAGVGVRGMKVYMSWNGATEYDGWRIYSGSGAAELSYVEAVKKGGFGTVATVEKEAEYLQAEAVEEGGYGGRKGVRSEIVAGGEGC